jgi:hypothetical protein
MSNLGCECLSVNRPLLIAKYANPEGVQGLAPTTHKNPALF